MKNSERAWRKHAQSEADLFREMIETNGRKVMVIAIASESESALKVISQPDQATRRDVVNFIAGMQLHIADLAKEAGLNPDDYIAVRGK